MRAESVSAQSMSLSTALRGPGERSHLAEDARTPDHGLATAGQPGNASSIKTGARRSNPESGGGRPAPGQGGRGSIRGWWAHPIGHAIPPPDQEKPSPNRQVRGGRRCEPLGGLGCGRNGDFVAMRGPSQHEPFSADHEGDVGALSGTEAGRQVANEKCAQNPRSGIEFGGFADAARLRVHSVSPARAPCVKPMIRRPRTATTTSNSSSVTAVCRPNLYRFAESGFIRRSPQRQPQDSQHHRPFGGSPGPRDRDLDIEESRVDRCNAVGASDCRAGGSRGLGVLPFL